MTIQLWTAFVLGLVGSLHCGIMCGPLICALPTAGRSRSSFLARRVVYNAGRIGVYCLLGLLFGALGKSLSLVGLQKWLSLIAGCAVLIGLPASRRWNVQGPIWKSTHWLKKKFGRLLQQQTSASLLGLGALNGLLPCGLVYVASAGAAAGGDLWQGSLFMLSFGLGTLPMMLGIVFAAQTLRWIFGQGQNLIPASIALVGLLLVLRGLSLGIPYLSPDLSNGGAHCAAC